MKYKVGTRGSKLALTQTQIVIDKLSEAFPHDSFEIVVIKTSGDKNLTSPIEAIGGKGVFVDAIEEALQKDEIQLAVHSMKDMPDTPGDGIIFARPMKREDPRDVLVLREAKSISELKSGARIATCSLRRNCQLNAIRDDLQLVPIRGNIDTRLRKLFEIGEDGLMLDGIILAAAGLNRLGLQDRITEYLDTDIMIPSPGQGTLAVELNEDNVELLQKINSLSDEQTCQQTFLERGLLKAVGAGCHDAFGAYAYKEDDGYTLVAILGNGDINYSKIKVHGKAEQALVDKAASLLKK